MSNIRENKELLNKSLNNIGNTMISVLEEEWVKVVVGYFIEASDLEYMQFFVLYNGADDYIDITKLSWDMDKYDDGLIKLEEMLKELHELCEKANDSWTSLTYVLEGDGSYKTHFGYDPIENYDGRFIMDWQSKYLD